MANKKRIRNINREKKGTKDYIISHVISKDVLLKRYSNNLF